ncbi:hypothetical protein [Mesorhizobium sp.]|uniref:hypothetical protein n=1 Tax=Mesorhizobium sp. TaxID=1871066 RepID=UPI000FE71E6A|nr:hypothetical protein [Mesorhizobium sp.]RWO81035.1 MAG: hypothetical protein EOQ96_25705 [Mesorhizobium sp.]
MGSKSVTSEGLGLVRFILVWSSLSPVFLLWALRGVEPISDRFWIPICTALFLLPTVILICIFRRARASQNEKTIVISASRDQREHLLTYLFAMLIPLFQASLTGLRDIVAISVAFLFIMFLFWHMRLHYMNLIFALWGYRIFTVEARGGTTEKDRDTGRLVTYAVISRRHYLVDGEPLTGYRLGGSVLVDRANDD